jgi:hypothetical protein
LEAHLPVCQSVHRKSILKRYDLWRVVAAPFYLIATDPPRAVNDAKKGLLDVEVIP